MVASHGDGRLAAMGIFAWLLSGLIAGAIARVFAPSPRGLGCIGTIALGLVGSVVGGTLANLAFATTDLSFFLYPQNRYLNDIL